MKKGEKVDIKVLKELILPSPLTAENFQELAGKAVVDEVQAGESIFSKGEIDRETIFLLDGDIILNDAENEPLVLRSGSEQAKKQLLMLNHVHSLQKQKHFVKSPESTVIF